MSMPDGQIHWTFPRLAMWLCDYMESLSLCLAHGSTSMCKTCCCEYEDLDKPRVFEFRTTAHREQAAAHARAAAAVFYTEERERLERRAAKGILSESARGRLAAATEWARVQVMKWAGYKEGTVSALGFTVSMLYSGHHSCILIGATPRVL